MTAPEDSEACFAKALDLLGRRGHFRAELRRKLAARGFGAESIAAALERAVELGYLGSEAELAISFAHERAERKGLGRAGVARELARRGAEADAIESALAALDPEAELERAREAAARWARRGTDAAALARHLQRKGYASSVIFHVSKEFARDADELPADDD